MVTKPDATALFEFHRFIRSESGSEPRTSRQERRGIIEFIRYQNGFVNFARS